MDREPSLQRRPARTLPALSLVLAVIGLLAIPVLVVTMARGTLPLVGLLTSAILVAPIAWLVLFARR